MDKHIKKYIHVCELFVHVQVCEYMWIGLCFPGLFVGKEGPMIHSGAIVGAGLPQVLALICTHPHQRLLKHVLHKIQHFYFKCHIFHLSMFLLTWLINHLQIVLHCYTCT